MTPLVTAIRPDGTPHPWRATSTPSYGPPQPMVPSPALVAAGFRERRPRLGPVVLVDDAPKRERLLVSGGWR